MADGRWQTADGRSSAAAGRSLAPDDRWSDERLVELCQHGSKDAFAILVRRYQDKIYNLVLRYVSNEEDALDLTQDAFLKAYTALPKFKGTSAFYTWLYRIAVNVCIDRKRRQRLKVVSLEALQTERTDFEDDEMGGEWAWEGLQGDPEKELLQKELRQQVQAAVAQLPERLKTVIILREYEKLSYAEIARITGARVGTVKSRLFQAREELKRLLTPYMLGKSKGEQL